MRKFQEVDKEFKKYNSSSVKLPVRSTKTAVCYDFFCPTDIILPAQKITTVWTNVKAYFEADEGLFLATRSSMGAKGIMLANGIGIIESDYADNPSNGGNLGFMFCNTTESDYALKQGEKLGQGFFSKFLTVDNEDEITAVRIGGFGSTGKE